MLDHNVQQLVNLGYAVTQAEYALKQSRNNVDRAMKILQVITATLQQQRVTKITYIILERR